MVRPPDGTWYRNTPLTYYTTAPSAPGGEDTAMHLITNPFIRRAQGRSLTLAVTQSERGPGDRLPPAQDEAAAHDSQTGDPLVSVIMPSYNHGRFIRAAIDSVANQTYEKIELIIIDDGSIDNSLSVIHEALEKHGSLKARLYTQENHGAPHAINRGLRLAHGEFVAILNSDDVYYPQRIEKLLRFAQETGCKFIFSKVDHISADGGLLGPDNTMRNLYLSAYEASKQMPHIGLTITRFNLAHSTSNFFMHRSVIERIGPFYDYKAVHDWDYLLRVFLETEPCLVDEPLLGYRIHGANTFLALVEQGKREEELMFANLRKALAVKRSGTINAIRHNL